MGKTIFITGSSGFIGKNLSEHFKDKYNIVAPAHKEQDLLSEKEVRTFFRDNDIDYVIHCANIGGNRKYCGTSNVVGDNLRMFFNIADNSGHFERLINFGSGAEYDKTRDLRSVREDEFGEYVPRDDYGFSKYCISKYIGEYSNFFCLRLFGVFGRYEDYEYKFISNAVVKNLLHMPVTIRQNVNFSWLYIKDLFPVVEYFLAKDPEFAFYNVTPPENLDLVSVAREINSVSDYKSDIIVENEGMNLDYSGSNERLAAEIEKLRFTPFDSALKELTGYYKSILPTIDMDTILQDSYASGCRIKK
ncbi:NAD-dependent epimerase/dehydratase family protein [Methanolacinia petrolearia]|uniref:NAD-dependent epimerase/dehydratase family protein n=1 Tax=Methanolacinia petrolearia TaxID=54120 RepID=UPI003BAC792F